MRSVLPVLILMLAGCGGSADNDRVVIENEKGTMVIQPDRRDDAAVRIDAINDKGAQASMSDGATPVWPSGVPDYAAGFREATVVHTMRGRDDDATSGMIVFETTAMTPEQVVALYKDRARANGLAAVSEVASAGNYLFGAEDKATGRTLSVQVGAAEGKTSGSVTYAEKARG